MATGESRPADASRLSEVLAALSLVSDLARGRPPEEAMRSCFLATALARSMGLSEPELETVYYATLLRSVGCTATSHEYAAAFGDDVAARDLGDRTDAGTPREVLSFLWEVSGRAPTNHLRAFAGAVAAGKKAAVQGARADCEVGAMMAVRVGLSPAVESALLQVFERWDGKGSPNGLGGEGIAVSARVAAVANAWTIFEEEGGPALASDVVTRWAGHALDPAIVSELMRSPDRADAVAVDDAWVETVAAEPGRPRLVSATDLDDIARGFANVVDLKSPFFHGHSDGVARLAEAAARAMGLPDEQVTDIRRAGLLHDVGRVGVPTGVWEKPGPLTTAEWESVRLHPYHTERILGRAPILEPLARIAGLHHERLDGAGYHRGAPASMLDAAARVLAAADVFHALTEERPHRPAYSAAEAARLLERESLDGDAVRAVIEAAGERPTAKRSAPAGLTNRELEVLRLLVRGRSEKEIAGELYISRSTVHTHVAHIYGKTGVSTRAGLAMFAMEHDLVRPGN